MYYYSKCQTARFMDLRTPLQRDALFSLPVQPPCTIRSTHVHLCRGQGGILHASLGSDLQNAVSTLKEKNTMRRIRAKKSHF